MAQNLEIIINGVSVDVPAATKVPITLRSPIFDFEDEGPSFAFFFELPLEAPLKKALSHPARLSLYSPVQRIHNIRILHGKVPMLEGKALEGDATRTSCELAATFGRNVFLENLGEITLWALPFEKIPVAGINYREALFSILEHALSGNNFDYSYFQVLNTWMGVNVTPAAPVQNFVQYTTLDHVFLFDEDDIFHSVTPFINLNLVLETICRAAGYTITENWFKEHPELARIVVYSNVDWRDYINQGSPGPFYIDPGRHLPREKKASEFFMDTLALFNCAPIWDHKTKSLRIVQAEKNFTKPAGKEISFITDKNYKVLKRDTFGYMLEIKYDTANGYGKPTSYFDTTPSPVLDTYAHIGTPVPEQPEQMRRATLENAYFIRKSRIRNTEAYAWKNAENYQDEDSPGAHIIGRYISGDGSRKVETTVGFPHMSSLRIPNYIPAGALGWQWSMPAVDTPMFWPRNPDNTAIVDTLLMIDRGPCVFNFTTEDGTLEIKWPYGNTDLQRPNKDLFDLPPVGDEIVQLYEDKEISLKLINDDQRLGNGIIPQFHVRTANWYKTIRRVVTYNVEFTARELADFSFDEVYRINQINHLAKEIRFDLSNSEKIWCEIDFMVI